MYDVFNEYKHSMFIPLGRKLCIFLFNGTKSISAFVLDEVLAQKLTGERVLNAKYFWEY